MQWLELLPLRVLVGLGRGILGCCNIFKPGWADRLDAYGTGGTCGFDAFSAQAVVYWWDHPYRHENCDKLHVPGDLQVLWLDFGRNASYLTIVRVVKNDALPTTPQGRLELTLRGVFQMVDTPARCSHWQSSETTTVTHISFKPPRTCISLGLGSALHICSCNRWLTPTSSHQSSSRLLCWNWQLSSVTHT